MFDSLFDGKATSVRGLGIYTIPLTQTLLGLYINIGFDLSVVLAYTLGLKETYAFREYITEHRYT